jgi:regulator of sigma E protease
VHWLSEAFFYSIPFLLIFTLIVFIHELGHFWAARKSGIMVKTFSIGIGPEIYGYTDARNTRWRISLVPLGGYVMMEGDTEDGEDSADAPKRDDTGVSSHPLSSGNLFEKSPWQRFWVSVSGPLCNYLLAVVLLGGIYSAVGRSESSLLVSETLETSPATAAGLLPGDVITHINETPVATFRELRQALHKGLPNTPITIRLLREEESIQKSLIPTYTEKKNIFGRPIPIFSMGVLLAEGEVRSLSILSTLWYSLKDVGIMSADMAMALGGIFTGTQPVGNLGGPIRIAEMAGTISKSGSLPHILLFIVTLSVNLGLVNLFPFPGLDGGTAMVCVFEGVLRRPLSKRVREVIGYCGFVMIGMLMLLGLGNDLLQLPVLQKIWNFLGL